MKKIIFIVFTAIAVMTLSVPALADWDADTPHKWAQLPDLENTGIDVSTAGPLVLADDFLCTQTEFITGIHIWGSWLGDYLPTPPTGGSGNAADVSFHLAIYSDIPADGNVTYSRPGEMLADWTFDPGEFTVRPYLSDVDEGWLNPPEEYTPHADTIIWQYNFDLDEPFEQQGTQDEPIVYWLGVSVDPNDDQAYFGWKTAMNHWNDDAVWLPAGATWQELYYPSNHLVRSW
jgi:hypothetical protein